MARVLLVEDDASLGQTLSDRLAKDRHHVAWARSVAEADRALQAERWDLVVLDVKLPDGSGLSLARHVKAASLTPVMLMTALNSAHNRLEGFESGADEYLPKPFHLREFTLRVRHVLESRPVPEVLEVDGRRIDLDGLQVVGPDGRRAFLQVKDARILSLLIRAAPKAVDRAEILDHVWGRDQYPTTRAVDNAIVRVRHALQDERGELVRTVRAVGYRWAPGTGEV